MKNESNRTVPVTHLGITAWSVPWDADELCRRAEKIGLEALHLDLGSGDDGYEMTRPENREAWLERTVRHGLRIASLALNDLCGHGFTAGLRDLRSERALETLKRGAETAAAMRIPTISVPHFFDNRITDGEAFHASAEALRLLCDLAEDAGTLICTENVLGVADLERLWDAVDRKNLRLMFDTQNYSAMGGPDAAEVFVQWQKYCGPYIHVKDGIRPGLGDRCLGKGDSDFQKTLTAVLDTGYTGDLIMESNYADEETLREDIELLRQY